MVVAPELLPGLRKLELSNVKGRAPGSISTPGILWFLPYAGLIPANSRESSLSLPLFLSDRARDPVATTFLRS